MIFFRPKKWSNSLKKIVLLPTKYEHVADVVVKFYSCTTYVKGVQGRLNATPIQHYLKNVRRKFALLQSLKFLTSKESNSHSFWATGLVLVSKEAEFCDVQSYWEFFFSIFEFWKDLRRQDFKFYRQKYTFLGKNV